MKTLFAFGCSNTYGEALPDCWDHNKKRAGDVPSKFAWPQILGDKLELNTINLSKPGISNKEIAKNIFDNLHTFNKDDVIIVLWSYVSRWCLFRDDGTIDHLAYWVKTETAQDWQKRFYFKSDRNFENRILIDYVYLLLKNNGLKVYFLIPDKETFDLIKFENAVFLNTTFDSIKSKYPKGLDNNHVGTEGNAVFADLVHNEIYKDTQ